MNPAEAFIKQVMSVAKKTDVLGLGKATEPVLKKAAEYVTTPAYTSPNSSPEEVAKYGVGFHSGSLIGDLGNIVMGGGPQGAVGLAQDIPAATRAISKAPGAVKSVVSGAGKANAAIGEGGAARIPAVTAPVKPNALTKMGNAVKSDVGKVHAPDAASSLYGSEHTKAVQDALTRNGVDQYHQLPQAARDLYDKKIYPELGSNPQLVSLDKITNNIVSEMRKMSPGLDQVEAKNAASSVINDLYDVSRNAQGHEAVVPSHIDTPSLFNIRQGLNDTAAVQKHFNGTPLSNLHELATVAGRNALSDIIAEAHPTIAQATKDYGLLKDAVPGLYKASQGGRGINVNLPVSLGGQPFSVGIPSAVGGPIRDVAGGTLRTAGKVADTPVGKVAGAAGLVGAGVAAQKTGLPQKIADTFTGNSQSKAGQDNGSQQNAGSNLIGSDGQTTQGNSIVSQSYSNIKPDPGSGAVELPQSPTPGQNQRHYMSESEYLSQLKTLGDQNTYGTPAYQNAKTQLDAQYSIDKEQAAKVFEGNQVRNFMQNAKQYNADGKDLQNTLSDLPTGFWNGVTQAGSIRAYNDPTYQKQLTQIQSFNNEFASAYKAVTGQDPGKDQLLDAANSPEQAAVKFNTMMQWIAGVYGDYLDPYLAITSGTGSQSQMGHPQSAPGFAPPSLTTPSQLPSNMVQQGGGLLPIGGQLPQPGAGGLFPIGGGQ